MAKRPPDPSREDRAWEVLKALHREVPEAVVIGGWASYLRLRLQKSHDIALIVDMPAMAKLRQKHKLELRQHVGGRKYKATVREIGIDVYATHQSELDARLRLPVEALMTHTEKVHGHRTLQAEALFIAKMAALLDRPDTLPGNKDRNEMIALLRQRAANFRADTVAQILSATRSDPNARSQLIAEVFDYLGEASGLTRSDKQLLKTARAALESAIARSRVRSNQPEMELDR